MSGQFNLDYAVYTPASTSRTSYLRKTVLRDDQDKAILLSENQWKREVGDTLTLPVGLAFNETLSQTSTQGASFTFKFTGE